MVGSTASLHGFTYHWTVLLSELDKYVGGYGDNPIPYSQNIIKEWMKPITHNDLMLKEGVEEGPHTHPYQAGKMLYMYMPSLLSLSIAHPPPITRCS